MPTATARAIARTLPESTNRRAVLGGILAAGAAATTILPAVAAAQTPTLSAIDRRVLDLWSQQAKLKAISDQVSE
jgi:hypothetical protein